jgi:hypothetical protein
MDWEKIRQLVLPIPIPLAGVILLMAAIIPIHHQNKMLQMLH